VISERLLGGLSRPWRRVLDWVLTIAVAIALVLAFEAEVAKPYRVPSSSMEPTLHCAKPARGCLARYSDRVIALRIVYRFRAPHRGEIAVFHAPAAAATCGESGLADLHQTRDRAPRRNRH
jgi:signal peptidase I